MARTLRATTAPAVTAFCLLLFSPSPYARDIKILGSKKTVKLSDGSKAFKIRAGRTFRMEAVGPDEIELVLRCMSSTRKSLRSCTFELRIDGKRAGRLTPNPKPDPSLRIRKKKAFVSKPLNHVLHVPKGAHLVSLKVTGRSNLFGLMSFEKTPQVASGGKKLGTGELPIVPLAPIGAGKKPAAEKQATAEVELPPLVPVAKDASGASKATAPPGKQHPGTRTRAEMDGGKPAVKTGAVAARTETEEIEASPDSPKSEVTGHVESGKTNQDSKKTPGIEAPVSVAGYGSFAVGPRIGLLLPVRGIGGDPTYVLGARFMWTMPWAKRLLALALGVDYYSIDAGGAAGLGDFSISTWVVPITITAIVVPMADYMVHPAISAGLGLYLGESKRTGKGPAQSSGITAAMGIHIQAGMEVDMAPAGIVSAGAGWSWAKADMGEIVENADLGGLRFELGYRYVF